MTAGPSWVRALKSGFAWAALLVALLNPMIAQAAKPGDLDPSFSRNGKVTTGFRGGHNMDSAESVAIDSRGRIVAAGTSGNPDSGVTIIARYRRDGRLDRSFSRNGKATLTLGTEDSLAWSVAIDARDRIVVAGRSCSAYPDCEFALARYRRNGTLDSSFGAGGKVVTDLGGGSAHAVAIDSRGRIVAAGGTAEPYGGGQFALVRYKPNGSLDPSFGSGGNVTTDIDSEAIAYSVAIDSQDRIVAAGVSIKGVQDNETALARYQTNGKLDPTFSGGVVTTNFGKSLEETHSVAIDGRRIVVAGFRETKLGDRFKLASYRRDGRFGHTLSNRVAGNAESVAVDSRGRVVAAGFRNTKRGERFKVARFRSSGSLDRSFSANGEVSRPAGLARSMAIDSRDRLVAAGAGRKRIKLARYIGYRRG